MDFYFEPISHEEGEALRQKRGKRSANKGKSKRKKNTVTYRKMTEQEKAQARADREYYNNWYNSIRKMKAKSQRLADINQRIYS